MAKTRAKTEDLVKRIETLSSFVKVPLTAVVGSGGMQLQRVDTYELLGPRTTKRGLLDYVEAMIDGVILFEPAVLSCPSLTQEDLDNLLEGVLEDAQREATPAPSALGHRPPAPLKPYVEPAAAPELTPNQDHIDDLDALLDGVTELDLQHDIREIFYPKG